MTLLESIAISVVGFVVGSLLMTVIGLTTAKFFVKRIIRDVFSEETKERASTWIYEAVQKAMKDGVGEAFKDEKIKKVVEEILEAALEKLKR